MAQSKAAASIENSYQGTGLNEADIQGERKQYGFNEIPEKHVGPVMGTLKRMWGPIPWLLEAAMLFELLLGKAVQAAVVFLLLVFSAVVGQIQEQRAKKADWLPASATANQCPHAAKRKVADATVSGAGARGYCARQSRGYCGG